MNMYNARNQLTLNNMTKYTNIVYVDVIFWLQSYAAF